MQSQYWLSPEIELQQVQSDEVSTSTVQDLKGAYRQLVPDEKCLLPWDPDWKQQQVL